MNLQDVLVIYEVITNEYGDDVRGSSYTVDADVEAVRTWARGQYAEYEAGDLTAWISPDELAYKQYGLNLSSLPVVYQGDTYRITGVRPGKSLLTGEPDLVELTLARTEVSDGS